MGIEPPEPSSPMQIPTMNAPIQAIVSGGLSKCAFSFSARKDVVPEEGLEPSQPRGPRDFESRASTNSATPARGIVRSRPGSLTEKEAKHDPSTAPGVLPEPNVDALKLLPDRRKCESQPSLYADPAAIG